MSERAHAVLLAALHERAKVQLIQESVSAAQTRLMLRVPPTSSRLWVELAFTMLDTASGQSWTLDISKMLVSKPERRFGWRFILQGADLSPACQELTRAVRSMSLKSRVADADEKEIPLVGSPNRSKTAGLYGHVAIGGQVRM